MLTIEKGSDNPILRAQSKDILRFTKNHRLLIEEMKQSVVKEKGLGLAAPQIGKNIKLVVLNITSDVIKSIDPLGVEKDVFVPTVLINPEINSYSEEETIMEEGCLSLPGIFGYVKRPKRIEVTYRDENLKENNIHAGGIIARVIQHEVDHLRGILFIDKVIK